MTIVPFLYKVNDLILNPLILLVFAISFLYFVYGIVVFLRTDPGDKGQTRIEARNAVMWGIVGMAIMFSVYGIIRFILATFGINTSEIEGEAGKIIRIR